jgi:Mu-like prophage I protein
MPWVVEKTSQCPASKPFGVFNKQTRSLRGRCHATKEEAASQIRALYAAEARNMSEPLYMVRQFSDIEWIDGNRLWVQVYPFDTWDHPQFGETTIDAEVASMMKDNFDKKVRGTDIVFDYEHGMDPAKGTKASGWYKDLEIRDNGLWGLIEFTEEAKKEIADNQWRYISGQHYDRWEHPHTKEEYDYVLSGGTLTNKPWVKGMAPLNFSELYEEKGGSNMPPDVVDEHADQEHAEPGTGSPPTPRTDERNDDNAADTGSRRDTPPIEQPNIDARLREILGLGDDADIIKAVTEMHTEVKPLREAAKNHSEAKSFAEAYPEQARELAEARNERMENRARAFSEQFTNILDDQGKPTGKGYPAVVVEKLKDVHKKFSEGTANVNDFTEVLELVGRTGLVDFTEHGSSSTNAFTRDDGDNAKAFAEAVAQIQTNDKLDYEAAVNMAIERHPQLFDAYRQQVTGRR